MSKRTIMYNSQPQAAVEVGFEVVEPWVEIKCADGAVIKLRGIIKEVLRLDAVKDEHGNPQYFVPFTWVMHTVPPPVEQDGEYKMPSGLVN